VVTKIVKHDVHCPMISKTDRDRRRLLSRHQRRFQAEFSDGTPGRQWMHWTQANQQQALGIYSREHRDPDSELELPAT
jgi:hypothetical protein